MKKGEIDNFWRYARIITTLFTGFVIIFSGCVDEELNETEQRNTEDNSQGISEKNNTQGTSERDYIYGTAKVESIKIITLESFPVQVQVIAKGYLPDGCTEIDEIKKKREENVFNINISTKRPKDAVCTQAIENFAETIPLEVKGLKAGKYTINVNGITESFELAVDNVPKGNPDSMQSRQQVVTEADNGKTINLENEETFYLKLLENPSTGYRWELNLTKGLNVSSEPDNVSGEYYPPQQPEGVKQPLVGAKGVHVWEIKAIAEGSQQVTGIYKRPWEDETAEEETFKLNVEVI